MDLTHRFSVPAPVDEAWSAFNDLEGLAPCFPGATIASVEGDDFAGSVKVKLGPIALLYSGSGRYLERNDAERRVVIEARGTDKRGNGTATATVTASFTENGEQTDVEVLTDLAITGKPAQFGRGVISDVSDKLLDQFVGCVSERFAAGLREPAPSPAATDATPAQTTTEQPTPASAPAPAPTEVQASGEPGPTAAPAPDSTGPRPDTGHQPGTTQEGLNILGTLGPVLLKRYGPAIAVLGLLLLVVIKIIRRRS
jgi:carbon monoxide dehydrogenase subunit G